MSLCGFFLMFGARKMSENARASSAFSAAFLAASYIFHRCKPDTVHGLFFLGRRKTNRFIEWQTIRRRIEGYRFVRVIFKQASKHPCADPSTVIAAIHEEKTDMLSIRPDGDLPNQFFSIKSAVILQIFETPLFPLQSNPGIHIPRTRPMPDPERPAFHLRTACGL